MSVVPTLGIVGAGQLARMTAEAASALGVRVVVLAERPDDSACDVAAEVVVGSPADRVVLAELARRSDVVTFDHELVDLELLSEMEAGGAVLRPSPSALRLAADKSVMRRTLQSAGLPVPPFRSLGVLPWPAAADAVRAFAEDHGWPVVVKAARGGYDGRGVWPVGGPAEAEAVCRGAWDAGTPLLVEAMVAIDTELAVVVARRPGGAAVSWPPVETAQVDGMCREVRFPGELDPQVSADATRLGGEVAAVAGCVGVLAVELFLTQGRLVVNELATRPHNSAHWTIDGAVTSQFENHVRAVLDLPLGDPSPAAPHVAMVNVVGGADGADPRSMLAGALAVTDAHVHLYGKGARPGRKLGHVTVCGPDAEAARAAAWRAARALGTPVPEVLAAAAGAGR